MDIHSTGCAAHVVYNGVHTSADILQIDIETVISRKAEIF